MSVYVQFGWKILVACSSIWVFYFAFQQGTASLYGLAAEKELLAWNHSAATPHAVEKAHGLILLAIEKYPEHPQYYFLLGRILQWQAYLSLEEQDVQQALNGAKQAFSESAQLRSNWPDTWAELLKIEAQLTVNNVGYPNALSEYLNNAARYGPYTPAVNIAISQVGIAKWNVLDYHQKWLVIEHLTRGLVGEHSRHILADHLKSIHKFKLACTLASRRQPNIEIRICQSIFK